MKVFNAQNAAVKLILVFAILLTVSLLLLSAGTSDQRAIESDSFDPMPNGTYIGNPFMAGGSPLNPEEFPVDILAFPEDSEAPEATMDETSNIEAEDCKAPVIVSKTSPDGESNTAPDDELKTASDDESYTVPDGELNIASDGESNTVPDDGLKAASDGESSTASED